MADNDCQKCHTLEAACDEAFYRYPHSCSHAVRHVVKMYIPDQDRHPQLAEEGIWTDSGDFWCFSGLMTLTS